ncbi:MAG TPA: DUF2085 domain-containing protein [Chloroflexia bacterium]|nr:DUF2085 domain-containing protein [Chloroflexia bacterium]
MQLTLYTRPDCEECNFVRDVLHALTDRYALTLLEVTPGDARFEELEPGASGKLPIIQADGLGIGRLVSPIAQPEIVSYLERASSVTASRIAGPAKATPGSDLSVLPPELFRENVLERMARWIGTRWVRIATIGLGIFVILPWLAPLFAAAGWWALADPIYTIYAFQCHQLPERSAHICGYEVGQCWRCNALYGGTFIFALIYGRARRTNSPRLQWLTKPLSPWLYVLLLLPIAIDGLTHMFGWRDTFDPNAPAMFGSFLVGSQVFSLNWILRIVTGLIAGIATVAFGFPRMQKAMDDAEAWRTMIMQYKNVRLAPKAGPTQ